MKKIALLVSLFLILSVGLAEARGSLYGNGRNDRAIQYGADSFGRPITIYQDYRVCFPGDNSWGRTGYTYHNDYRQGYYRNHYYSPGPGEVISGMVGFGLGTIVGSIINRSRAVPVATPGTVPVSSSVSDNSVKIVNGIAYDIVVKEGNQSIRLKTGEIGTINVSGNAIAATVYDGDTVAGTVIGEAKNGIWHITSYVPIK